MAVTLEQFGIDQLSQQQRLELLVSCGTASPMTLPSLPPNGTCANWRSASRWPTLIRARPNRGKPCGLDC
jgi:hypothetical protein